MENISVHAVVVKESIVQLYDQITAKISPKKVLLPLSGICFVYYFFIRKCKERDTPIIVKEPCRPDQPYTGHEEPKVRLVSAKKFVLKSALDPIFCINYHGLT